jgi:hypothetical protein
VASRTRKFIIGRRRRFLLRSVNLVRRNNFRRSLFEINFSRGEGKLCAVRHVPQ